MSFSSKIIVSTALLSLALCSCTKDGFTSSKNTDPSLSSNDNSILGTSEDAQKKSALLATFFVETSTASLTHSKLILKSPGSLPSSPAEALEILNSLPSVLFGGSQIPSLSGINAGNIANQMCVAPEVISLDINNLDIILHFNCKEVTGPVELKQVVDISSMLTTRTINTNLILLDKGRNKVGSVDSNTVITTNTSNTTNIRGVFDDQFTKGNSILQAKGKFEVTFTSDDSSNLKSGNVEFASATDITIDGTNIGTVVVTSQNLHVSQCGFDKGSFTIDLAGKETIVVTFNGCGKPIVTRGSGGHTIPVPLPAPY